MGTRSIEVGAVRLQVTDEGEGPPVLLLHGFPDSARLWRNQIPALVQAGFRVIAPDLRGFGESEKPAEVGQYGLPIILQDVLALLAQFGIERTHVVAHDWGAALGWVLASIAQEKVDRLVALSVGHPASFRTAGLEQKEKSWYMLLFQFQDVAERLLQQDDWRLFRDWVRHHPESERWIPDLSRPGALSAALAWYRANVSPEQLFAAPPTLPPVTAPTLGIWSDGDAYLTEAQMVGSAQFVAGPWRYRRVEGASHWLQLDRPEVVNRLLLEFLGP
jgi:pimeloyl-ACP methyl ester carboxylesterase